MIQVSKMDSKPAVHTKIHEAFPLIFSKRDTTIQFQFLSAKSHSLIDASLQDLGLFNSWTGEAILALAGQGCLYILPNVKVCMGL